MKSILNYIKKYKFLLLIILPALLLYMLVIFPSGTFFCFKDACGINFWGAHGHDAIWHLAIANVSFNQFPFRAPTFSGESLYGYNYLLDFVIFLLSKVGIPAIISYFKILPVVWFIAFSLLLITLARKIKDNPLFIGLFLFFNYFTGSFYYLIKLYRDHSINDSSTQIPQPVVLMMVNPQFAFSLIFIICLLILIKNRKFDLRSSVIAGLLIFFLLGLKFYGGVIGLFLILSYLLLNLFHGKRGLLKSTIINLLILGFFVFAGVVFFFNPTHSFKSGSIFGFVPFALVHTITETPNLFYLQSLTDARYFLIAHGGIGPRLILIEALNLLIFLFIYLGTRFFGLLYIPILFIKRRLDKFDFSVILTIFFSILLTITLVQKAEWWNTIQFFYYAIFLLTIYLARLAFDLVRNKKLSLYLLVLFIMLLSVPTTYDLIKFFWITPGASYLPKEEITALEFLKKQPDGVVLTSLYNNKWKNNAKSNPLFAYEDTAYVSAFSGKQVYLANILQLRLTGVPYENRLERVKNGDCSILNEIDYVYEVRELYDTDNIVVKCKPKNVKLIYRNPRIFIHAVIKKPK